MSLPSPRKTDQVFQLSQTELAFILIFLLLLLAGAIVLGLQKDLKAAQDQAAAGQQEAADAREDRRIAENVNEQIRNALGGANVRNPNKAISDLIEKAKDEAERKRLQEEDKELQAKITALEEIERLVQGLSPDEAQQKAEGAINSGQIFKSAFESEIGEKIEPGTEGRIAKEIADIIKRLRGAGVDPKPVPKITKQNQDLRGQVAWLTSKLNSRGGRDYPPCWADEKTGKIQYLFRIEIGNKGLDITKAWPEEREADAKSLPGIDRLLSGKTQSIGLFRKNMNDIDQECRANNCRHYVILANRVNDLKMFNRHRYAVEEFFYKYEVR